MLIHGHLVIFYKPHFGRRQFCISLTSSFHNCCMFPFFTNSLGLASSLRNPYFSPARDCSRRSRWPRTSEISPQPSRSMMSKVHERMIPCFECRFVFWKPSGRDPEKVLVKTRREFEGRNPYEFTPTEGMFEGIREFWGLAECPIPRLIVRNRSSAPFLSGKEVTAYCQFLHPFPNLFDAFAIATLVYPGNLEEEKLVTEVRDIRR